jgi:propanediol dehydratase small subunit
MSFSIIALVASVLAFGVWALKTGGLLPEPLRQRSCQGKGWRRTFPNAPKQDIREFLSVFVEAFAFDEREKLKLSPDDGILQIYRHLYPHRWMPDSLEVETLAKSLERRYQVRLGEIWREDITLGDLFAQAQAGGAQ